MTTLDLATATTMQLLIALTRREVSSVELLDGMVANIERMNPSVNAVVAMDMERARAEATAADNSRAAGDPCGPLHGLPMTIKDCYETLDLVTAAGAPELAEHVPTCDADVVRLLRRAGAIVWAKTNVPYHAGDHQTYNDLYGVTNNPWDLTRTAGGSSGGAAVAVACGFTTAEIGSDIGNSIRQPAALNGVFGLKTTYGLVSGRGHIPRPSGSLTQYDLGVFGPLGRSCGDLRVLLEVLTNSGSAFGGMPGAELPRFEQQPDIADLRIGVWADDAMAPVDSSVKDLVEDAARRLADEGAQVDGEIRPAIASSALHRGYMQLLNSTLSADISGDRWDGLVERAAGSEEYAENDAVTFARDSALSHRSWLAANERRAHAQLAWADVFEHIDVMIAPIQPVAAFPHDTERPYGKRTLKVNGSDAPYRGILFWAGLATMPHLPAVAIPIGHTAEGLPVGVQLIGPKWSDHKLLSIGEEISSVLGQHFTPPPLVAGSLVAR
ncbi:MAG: amidase family protein [Ilumatobacter sp.]|uniref:amidase family protein n=1 Tax=Ilumatobacter sp. TaxID=1967498 RepID=UPI003C77912F